MKWCICFSLISICQASPGKQRRIRSRRRRLHNKSESSPHNFRTTTTSSSSIDRPAPDIFDPVHTPTDWYIEGTILPTAQCHECQNDLEAEQTLIFNTLRQEFGLAHVERLYRDVFLVNAQYVKISTTKDTQSTEYFIKSVPGVKQVGLSGKLQLHDEPILQQIGWPTTFDVAADYLDAVAARDEFCLTGKGVRVAILDTGIDYTHRIFGGPGTPDAFLAAYGLNSSSPENRQRDGLFPTSKIVDGYDFVGDSANQGVMEIRMDEDPIDYRGGVRLYENAGCCFPDAQD